MDIIFLKKILSKIITMRKANTKCDGQKPKRQNKSESNKQTDKLTFDYHCTICDSICDVGSIECSNCNCKKWTHGSCLSKDVINRCADFFYCPNCALTEHGFDLDAALNRKSKFIKSRRPQRKGTQTSSDGRLTVPVKPSAGKKPGQYRRRKAAKTTTINK